MSALRRSIEQITSATWRELKRAAKELGADGTFIIENADVTVDYGSGRTVARLGVVYRNKEIWSKSLPLTTEQLESGMPDSKLIEAVTTTMRAHMSLISQTHFVRLDRHFPNSIEDVTVNCNPETLQKTIYVKFKNGHVAEGLENEAKSDEFLARCAMLFDLPCI